LSALPDEIEIEDEEEGRRGCVIETSADEYCELIPWRAVGIKVGGRKKAREEEVR